MAVKLQEALTAEQEARAAAERARERARLVPMSGADLARECSGALRAALALRPGLKVSESERDALVQALALAALEAHRRANLTREHPLPLTRGSVGRNYLQQTASGILRERTWRDTLDGYTTRGERERGYAPLIAGSVNAEQEDTREDASESAPDPRGGWLSIALMRERDRSADAPALAVESAHLPALAATLASALADACETSGKDRESVTAAVLAACGITLAEQAGMPGALSLPTLKRRSTAGAAILRDRLSAGELVALVRDVADTELEDRALRRSLRTSLPPVLEALAQSAASACESVRAARYRAPGRAANAGRVSTASALPLSRLSGPVMAPERSAPARPPVICRTCFKVHPAGYPEGVHPARSALL